MEASSSIRCKFFRLAVGLSHVCKLVFKSAFARVSKSSTTARHNRAAKCFESEEYEGRNAM
jgi:hypothetical protein